MKKLTLALAMVLASLTVSASNVVSDEQIDNDMAGCKAVSAEIISSADAKFMTAFGVQFYDLKNPSNEQQNAYNEYIRQAEQVLAEDVKRFCGHD